MRPFVHNTRLPDRAFTLVEMIVVIIILAVLASVIAPRLSGQTERAAEGEAVAVQRLLTAAAERAALTGGQGVGIQYVRGERGSTISIVQRQTAPAGSAQLTDPAWRPDALAAPVELSHLELKHAAADGRRLDSSRWLVPMGGAQARPAIGLSLAPRDTAGRFGFHIELTPDATVASRRAVSASEAGGPARPLLTPDRMIDLDATGRGDSTW